MNPEFTSSLSQACRYSAAPFGRRQCLKSFLSATGAFLAAGLMANRAPAANSGPGVLRIKVSSLKTLIPVGGSVMITYDAGATRLLINRASAGGFHVLDPTCTHAGCTVGLYEPANQGISCPCHGSFFDISGQVLNGPASLPLATYQSSFDGDDTLSVMVPGLQFYIDRIQEEATTPEGLRLKLSFPTRSFATYSIQRTNSLTETPQTIKFAATPAGPANQTTLLGSGGPMSVWVDAAGSRGFFALSLQLFEVR